MVLEMITCGSPPADNSFDPGGPSGLSQDNDDIEVKWDLAMTHVRNEELRERNSVKQFFAKVSTIESLQEQETRDWFASLPHDMRKEVIPLFESSDGSSEDYQLYPSYSWLAGTGEHIEDPDIDFCHLRLPSFDLGMPHIFMPLGRLFVNAPNGSPFNERCNSNRSRLTRWTGYEVFLSSALALWIVFDEKSLAHHARPWYPVSCGMIQFLSLGDVKHEPPDLAAFYINMVCFLTSISSLQYADFGGILASMVVGLRSEMRAWKFPVRISDVEKSVVKKILGDQVQTPTQDTLLVVGKGKQRTDNIASEDATKNVPPPRLALSGYMFFANENREKVRDENPGIHFGKPSAQRLSSSLGLDTALTLLLGDIGKVLGKKWSSMTSEEKRPYNYMASGAAEK
jgi:hypothetical protein